MDGIHDIGGKTGFGQIPFRQHDYTFKYEWQRRSFALTIALGGSAPFSADIHRYKIEQMPESDYVSLDYFEKWALATSNLLLEAGLVNQNELMTGQKEFDVNLENHIVDDAVQIVEALNAGEEFKFPDENRMPRFKVGDQIIVSDSRSVHHTRVPGYVRGKVGTISTDEGIYQFADSVAKGDGKNPQHYYNVMFLASTLWGDEAESPDDKIYLDLAESYLQHA